jgi:hypothetical protein
MLDSRMARQRSTLDRGPGWADNGVVGFKPRTKATDAADAALLERLRRHFAGGAGVSERRMFGGVAFMIRGNMCCGVLRGDLMVRVLPAEFDAALSEPHAGPMAITGRPLRGFVQVRRPVTPAPRSSPAGSGVASEWPGPCRRSSDHPAGRPAHVTAA